MDAEPLRGRAAIATIRRVVARHFCMTVLDLVSMRRMRGTALARQIAMLLSIRMTGHSVPQIARAFGDRHPSTVLDARDRVEGLERADPQMAALLADLSAHAAAAADIEAKAARPGSRGEAFALLEACRRVAGAIDALDKAAHCAGESGARAALEKQARALKRTLELVDHG